MRIWFKMFKDTKILKDETIENYEEDTRTHKILQAVEDVCYHMDLGKPIWLDSNVKEFQRHSKTRFTKDNFVEEIEFQFLELHVIEED